jgi:molybdopterin molybdotransferase
VIGVDEATAAIIAAMSTVSSELVTADEALGRVLAEDLVASVEVPRFANSAMDGYAVHARSTENASADTVVTLDVIGESAAGGDGAMVVTRQEAARIFTGAPIPKGCDAVIMQEDVTRDGSKVAVRAKVERGENIRSAGEDIKVGAPLLGRGTVIGPGDIAVAATQGRYFLPVRRAPGVAVIATGNELAELDTLLTAAATSVPNGNAIMLAAQVREAGGVPLRFPIVRDDPEALAGAFREAAAIADVVMTSGGVSAGDHDHIPRVVAENGEVVFHKVRMRPGKPFIFARVGGKAFFGLPGNPVSSFVAFELFVRPALRTMLGAPDALRPIAPVVLTAAIKPARDRRSYIRVRLQRSGATLQATASQRQGSSDLTSIASVDGLAIIEAGGDVVSAGTVVPCLLLRTR